MKKLILLALAVVLWGCSEESPAGSMNVDGKVIQTQGVGEDCGGILNKKCGPSLECKRDYPAPESKGTCVDTVVDKSLECEANKAPVCGLKERQKNGYLNACEAERHGAEILYERFCKSDPSIPGNCKAQVRSIGNCEAFFEGYEFDGNTCVMVPISGCELESPFASLQECQQKCE